MNLPIFATLSPLPSPDGTLEIFLGKRMEKAKKKLKFFKKVLAFYFLFCYYISCAYEKRHGSTQQQGGATDGKVRVLR